MLLTRQHILPTSVHLITIATITTSRSIYDIEPGENLMNLTEVDIDL